MHGRRSCKAAGCDEQPWPCDEECAAARSPHSMVFSVIGRMGLLGLALWLAASAAMMRTAWTLLRHGSADDRGMASVVCVMWVSASFGVVLEGPMGAVVFWSVLGLAHARAKAPVSDPASPCTRCTSTASGEWPVAKGDAFCSESASH